MTCRPVLISTFLNLLLSLSLHLRVRSNQMPSRYWTMTVNLALWRHKMLRQLRHSPRQRSQHPRSQEYSELAVLSDDLESLGYVLLYFLQGFPLLQGLSAKDHAQKNELILEKKKMISTKDLYRGLPKEFLTYFGYIRSFKFDDTDVYLPAQDLSQSLHAGGL